MPQRSWTDSDLRIAVESSSSWRGVLRALGKNDNSAGMLRHVKGHALRLGLDTAHFRGQRRWSDEQLVKAVSESTSLVEIQARLGLSSTGTNGATVKAHAQRLSLDLSHLKAARSVRHREAVPFNETVRPEQVRYAAASMATAWFLSRGHHVSVPVEPAPYDLIVESFDGLKKVQVKTATRGYCSITRCPDGKVRALYSADEVDFFFIIDAELAFYLIPQGVVAGLSSITMRAYVHFRLQ
jgi:PD-(D/E)XK endonuclease